MRKENPTGSLTGVWVGSLGNFVSRAGAPQQNTLFDFGMLASLQKPSTNPEMKVNVAITNEM